MNCIARSVMSGIVLLAMAQPGPALAQTMPTKVGQCVRSRITVISTRLDRTPGSGSAVNYANGAFQVGYDTLPDIENSKPGDAVLICLVGREQNCPKGSHPSITYTTTNLRTQGSWTLGDSAHGC